MPNDSKLELEEKYFQDLPVYWLLRQLADRWSFPVIAELYTGAQRFLELRRALAPISKRMLTLTLRRLTAAGFVERHILATVPPQVSYALSPLGRSLCEALKSLNAWTKLHHATFAAALKMDQRESDQAL